MKKFTFILVMIFIASTAYNQSSRRTTSETNNGERTRATRTSRTTTTTSPTYASNRTSTNRTNTDRKARTTTTVHTQSNNRSAHRQNNTTNHRVVRTSTRYDYRNNHGNHNAKHRVVTHNCRVPRSIEVVWTSDMHRRYVRMYPGHNWNYHHHYGSRIATIPAYEAKYYIGNVKNVYGRVTDVYYSRETDEFVLSIGRFYPNQYITVVIPGNIARRQSHRPVDFYLYQDIHVTGLISSYHGEPELFVKRNAQLKVY